MKKTSLLIIMMLSYGIAMTQSFDFNFKSNNQLLIEDAVKQGFIIIRQSYQLCDTTANPYTYFGKNNDDFFGQTFSLGIITEKGIYCNNQAICPWNFDTSFEDYRNTKYKPVLYQTYYRFLTNSTYQEIKYDRDSLNIMYSNLLYSIDFDGFEDGFVVDNQQGEKQGWLVLVDTNDHISVNDTVPFRMSIYRSPLIFSNDSAQYNIEVKSMYDSFIGGVYITPTITAVGQITFVLSGIVQNNNHNWIIIPLLTTKDNLDNNNDEIILTPIEQSAPIDSQNEDKSIKKKEKKH